MDYQAVFQRYEMKYFLAAEQQEELLQLMEAYMRPDSYGNTTIRNIYYDTGDFRLIRRSLEHPVYKEKLRVRSYRRAGKDSTVFVELKKKYHSVVYKRRLAMPEQMAAEWIRGDGFGPEHSQIAGEMEYFFRFYGSLLPAAFLSYDREAWFSAAGDGFRVTFDRNILCRRTKLSLCEEVWGEPLLEPDQVLMEIKTPGGIPLWLTHFLTENRIFKTSFSKYGTAWQRWQQEASGREGSRKWLVVPGAAMETPDREQAKSIHVAAAVIEAAAAAPQEKGKGGDIFV